MERIYADYNATCPIEPEHYQEVFKILLESDHNPSSIHHYGRKAKIALEDARKAVAKLLASRPNQVLFTSGATESNNSALKGVVYRENKAGRKPHIIVTAIEHPSVLQTANSLEESGLCDLSVLPVDQSGQISVNSLEGAIRESTRLLCMIHVNNETGAVLPVVELSRLAKQKSTDVHIHLDCVQALGKLDMTWLGETEDIDSIALSAHKVGGFKGVGALFLRSGIKLNPLIEGGGQERKRRAGTENIPGIVSFGLRARELAQNSDWLSHLPPLYQNLLDGLGQIPGLEIHGNPDQSLNTTVNFHLDRVSGEDIMLNLDLAGIAVSTGSACSSGMTVPSTVITAMGYDSWIAKNSIRVSLGARSGMTTLNELSQP